MHRFYRESEQSGVQSLFFYLKYWFPDKVRRWLQSFSFLLRDELAKFPNCNLWQLARDQGKLPPPEYSQGKGNWKINVWGWCNSNDLIIIAMYLLFKDLIIEVISLLISIFCLVKQHWHIYIFRICQNTVVVVYASYRQEIYNFIRQH